MSADDAAPVADGVAQQSSVVNKLGDPAYVRGLISEPQRRRQTLETPQPTRVDSFDVPFGVLKNMSTVADEFSATFSLAMAEREQTQLGKDGLLNKKVVMGWLGSLALGLELPLPLPGPRDHDQTNYRELCLAVGNKMTTWLGKAKEKKKRSREGAQAHLLLTIDAAAFDPDGERQPPRALAGGANFSCTAEAYAEIVGLQQQLREAKSAHLVTNLKLGAEQTRAAKLAGANTAANRRAGTSEAKARRAEAAAATERQRAGEAEERADGMMVEAVRAMGSAAEAESAKLAAEQLAQSEAAQREAAAEEEKKAAGKRAREAEKHEKELADALKKNHDLKAKVDAANEKARETEKQRKVQQAERKAKADELTKRNAELGTRVRCLEDLVCEERAEFDELKDAHAQATARVEGLEKLTRPEAAATIAKLERELEAATSKLKTVEAQLISKRSDLARVTTQANQSQKASDAAAEKIGVLEAELRAAGRGRDSLTEHELHEQLADERAARDRERTSYLQSTAAKDEKICELEKKVKELEWVAKPPVSKFMDSDGSFKIEYMTVASEVMARWNIASDNIYPLITLVGEAYWGIAPELRTITVPACEGKERRKEERWPVPGSSTMAQTAPLVMAVLSQAQVGMEIRTVQKKLEEEGKDPVKDINLGATTDGATKRGRSFFCMMLTLPYLAVTRCATLVCGREGKATEKLKKMQAGFGTIRETMHACAGGVPGVRPVSALGLSTLHALCSSSLALVGGFVTDRCAAEKAATVGEAMTEAKRTAHEEQYAARHLASGQSVALIVRPPSATDVVVETMPTGRDDAENARIEEYLKEHELREKLSFAMDQLLEERPTFAEESLAALLEEIDSGETAVPTRYSSRCALAAAESDDAHTLDEEREKYRTDFPCLPQLLGAGVDAALRSSARAPLLVVAATLRGEPAASGGSDGGSDGDDDRGRGGGGGDSRGAPPAAPSTPEEEAARDRADWSAHPRLRALGRFLLRGTCVLALTILLTTMWSNCMEHALVNTFDAMGKELMAFATETLGPAFLAEAAALQSGTKVKTPDAKKFRTGVWLFDSPIWHFIYRLCVYLSPFSEKAWAKGDEFIEWVLANGKLSEHEQWIMKDFSAIHGSRNGVFWKNAIAIVLWRDRILEFLRYMQAKQGDEGGKTRDYLIMMLESDTVYKCLCALAVCYLNIYLPVMHAYTTVGHLRELASITQRVYDCLNRWRVDPRPFLTGAERIFPDQRVDPRARLIQLMICSQDSMTGKWFVSDEAVALFARLFGAGARAYHRHHAETMTAPHSDDPDDPDRAHWEKCGGKNLNLAEWQEEKRANVATRNVAVERSFSHLKSYIDAAVTRNDFSTCAMVMFKLNDTGTFWRDTWSTWTLEQKYEMAKAIRKLVQARAAFDGSVRAQKLKSGHVAKDDFERLQQCLAEKKALDAELKEELERKRVRTWRELEGMTLKELYEQVLCVKKCDGKADWRISAMTSKKLRLDALVRHYKLKVSAAAIKAAAAKKARGESAGDATAASAAQAQPAAKRRRSPAGGKRGGTHYEVQCVTGAITHGLERLYGCRWLGWGEEADSFVSHDDLLGTDDTGAPAIHPEIDDEVARADAVAPEEVALVLAMLAASSAAEEAPLVDGDRVFVRRDGAEDWETGTVGAAAGTTVSVQLDGEPAARTFSRATDEVLKARPPSRPLAVTDLVRMAFKEGAPPITDEHPTGYRWFYGSVDSIDVRQEIASVHFNNGETYKGPAFLVELVASAVQSA